MFRPLGSREHPWLCLFFVYDPGIERTERLTPGIAALVSEDGVAVTMSHVVLGRQLTPGKRLWLIHVASRVALRADVLEAGWTGPDWRQPWKDPSQMTPEELGPDIAFLQLDLDTCSNISRYRVPEASA